MFGDKESQAKRFEVVINEVIKKGNVGNIVVYVDTETGVQYVHVNGMGEGGMTVLVDENGKPLLNEMYRQRSK